MKKLTVIIIAVVAVIVVLFLVAKGQDKNTGIDFRADINFDRSIVDDGLKESDYWIWLKPEANRPLTEEECQEMFTFYVKTEGNFVEGYQNTYFLSQAEPNIGSYFASIKYDGKNFTDFVFVAEGNYGEE